jgi:hypothetical protein
VTHNYQGHDQDISHEITFAPAEHLRASAHMILAEELIASLTDGTGIAEEQYTLAMSCEATPNE